MKQLIALGLGFGVWGLLVCSCCPTITKDTRIESVTDTIYIPERAVNLTAESDSVVQDEPYNETEELPPGRDLRSAPKLPMVNDQLPILNEKPTMIPFTAYLDTTVSRVKMSLRYRYPADRWIVTVIEPDTFALHTRMDTSITKIVEKQKPYVPWWCYLTLVALGGILVWGIVTKVRAI